MPTETKESFQVKTAVLNAVTREQPPNLTNKDFTIEDWGRKISHQQEEGKGRLKLKAFGLRSDQVM